MNGDTILNTINEDSNEDVLNEMIEIIDDFLLSQMVNQPYTGPACTRKDTAEGNGFPIIYAISKSWWYEKMSKTL